MPDVRVPNWKILIDLPVWQQIKNYTKAAAGEWSGLGIFTMTPDGPVVTDFWLLEQESTSGDTEIDEAAAGKLAFDLANEGKPCDLNVWIHSHGNLGTFWSGKDENDGVAKMCGAPPFLVSVVMNKAGDMLGRIDFKSPLRATINNVPVAPRLDFDEDLYKVHAAEVAQKVLSPVYRSVTTLSGSSIPQFDAGGIRSPQASIGEKAIESDPGFLRLDGLDVIDMRGVTRYVRDMNDLASLVEQGYISQAAYDYAVEALAYQEEELREMIEDMDEGLGFGTVDTWETAPKFRGGSDRQHGFRRDMMRRTADALFGKDDDADEPPMKPDEKGNGKSEGKHA